MLKIKQPFGVSALREGTKIFVQNIPIKKSNRYMDMGTGTGYIAIYLSKKGVVCDAVDISQKALSTARENASANNVKINFFLSDFFSDVNKNFVEKYDVIIFNAPTGTTKSNYFLDFIKSLLRKFEVTRTLLLIFALTSFTKNRIDINSRFIRSSLPHLNKGGSLFLLIYKKELTPLASEFKSLKFISTKNKRLNKSYLQILEIRK